MSSIDKIASLLAYAERSTNEAEANAFLEKAQKLASLHSIDLALAQSKIAKRELREVPTQKQITVGQQGKHANQHFIRLFGVVAQANDVTNDIAHNSTYVVAFGMPSDIELTEALWGAISHQMVEAANQYLASNVWRGETYVSRETYRENVYTRATARTAFYKGYISRIGQRLMEARAEAIAESEPNQESGLTEVSVEEAFAEKTPTSLELVLVAKADEVKSFYKKASNARGTWGGGNSGVSLSDNIRSASHSAADRARTSSNKAIAGMAGAIG